MVDTGLNPKKKYEILGKNMAVLFWEDCAVVSERQKREHVNSRRN